MAKTAKAAATPTDEAWAAVLRAAKGLGAHPGVKAAASKRSPAKGEPGVRLAEFYRDEVTLERKSRMPGCVETLRTRDSAVVSVREGGNGITVCRFSSELRRTASGTSFSDALLSEGPRASESVAPEDFGPERMEALLLSLKGDLGPTPAELRAEGIEPIRAMMASLSAAAGGGGAVSAASPESDGAPARDGGPAVWAIARFVAETDGGTVAVTARSRVDGTCDIEVQGRGRAASGRMDAMDAFLAEAAEAVAAMLPSPDPAPAPGA